MDVNHQAVEVQLRDVPVVRVITFRDSDMSTHKYSGMAITISLMIRVNEDGITYRRIGSAEVLNYEDFVEVGYVRRDLTIPLL